MAGSSTWGNPIALGVSPWEKTAVAPLLTLGEANAEGEVQMALSYPLWASTAKTAALTFD